MHEKFWRFIFLKFAADSVQYGHKKLDRIKIIFLSSMVQCRVPLGADGTFSYKQLTQELQGNVAILQLSLKENRFILCKGKTTLRKRAILATEKRLFLCLGEATTGGKAASFYEKLVSPSE